MNDQEINKLIFVVEMYKENIYKCLFIDKQMHKRS